MRGEALAALVALTVAAACGNGGSGGLPASGTGTSCPAGEYILDGGCAPLPPFSDAEAQFDDGGAGADAGAGAAGDSAGD